MELRYQRRRCSCTYSCVLGATLLTAGLLVLLSLGTLPDEDEDIVAPAPRSIAAGPAASSQGRWAGAGSGELGVAAMEREMFRWLQQDLAARAEHRRAEETKEYTEAFSRFESQMECLRETSHDVAIVFLVPNRHSMKSIGTSDWDYALRALGSLRRLEDGNRAEVVIFHDEQDRTQKSDLQVLVDAVKPRSACTVEIQFALFPTGWSEANHSPWQTGARRNPSKWGYEHMIRFMFLDLFETDALWGYKYWMRLDTDSQFTLPVEDPFGHFDFDSELAYMHNTENQDCGATVEGLPDFARKYGAAHGVTTEVDALARAVGVNCIRGYYNNVEIGRISAFQTRGMQMWRDAVRKSAGIYRHRWGDAVLRRLGIEFNRLKIKPLPRGFKKSYTHATPVLPKLHVHRGAATR